MMDVLLKNAVTSTGLSGVDVAIDDGKIVACGPGLELPTAVVYDLDGRLLIPGFVESHLHLDIALMNPDAHPGRLEVFTGVANLNLHLETRRRLFTRQDIEARAGRALEMASRHGVTAMRAQCHVDTEVGLKHLHALMSVREKYASLVTLQIVAFPQQGLLRDPATPALFREAFRQGANVMGCASNLDPGQDFRRHIDTAFELAMEAGVDLDIHADLGLPEQAGMDDLESVYAARRAIELGYQGRVTAGHVCALDSATPEVVEQAAELFCRAGMSVVSQPDMYRLGRGDRRSIRRGLTRVRQLLAAGVNVTYASNNVRDVMRPLGNFDLLEEGLILAYGVHMDSVQELELLLKMCTENAARALGLPDYGLGVGCAADLVVLDAVSPSDAIVSQAEKRFVFKAGRLVGENQLVSNRINRRL